MKSITETTILEAPANAVWRAVQRPEAFTHVTGPWLRYPPAERLTAPWRVGARTSGWALLFRFIPFSRHTIEVVTIDDDTRTLVTEEGGGLVRTWRHWIILEAIDPANCRYQDRIEIEAGWLTPLVAAFASRFYRYRQRRWQRLAKLLAAALVQGRAGP